MVLTGPPWWSAPVIAVAVVGVLALAALAAFGVRALLKRVPVNFWSARFRSLGRHLRLRLRRTHHPAAGDSTCPDPVEPPALHHPESGRAA